MKILLLMLLWIFFVIVIIFIYSFIIKLDSGNNSSSGKNNSSGNNNSSGKNNSSGNNSSSNLSIFEKEYTDILKNIIKLFKTEANIFSPFLFSYLTFFFYISTISKKYNIYEYLFICLFIILIPILLVGLILFITGFFSYINSAVLDEVSNNIYIYIHCIVLFLTIYSLSYPINNLLNNNNKFTKDLLIIMIILLFVSCFSIFIIFMHENINILSMFHRNNEIFQKKKIFGIEMPIYLILYLLIIIGLYTASILVPREIIIYATTLMTLVSFLIYIFQKSNA